MNRNDLHQIHENQANYEEIHFKTLRGTGGREFFWVSVTDPPWWERNQAGNRSSSHFF